MPAALAAAVVMVAAVFALAAWLIARVAREQERFAYLVDLDRDEERAS